MGTENQLGSVVNIKVLHVRNENITPNAINNSSLVFLVESQDISSKRVLFLGDLGKEGGDYILSTIDPTELKADYVQMAHHGQRGVNEDFYKAVMSKYAMWPSPSNV